MKRLFLLFIAFLIVSCKSSTGPEESETQEDPKFKKVNYMPFDEVEYWAYEDQEGETDTTYTRSDTTIDGQDYFVTGNPEYYSEEAGGGLMYEQKHYYTYTDTALVRYQLSDEGLEDAMVFKFPNESGEFEDNLYEQKHRSTDRFEWYTLVKSTDSTITTPAGTFDCYVFFSAREDKERGQEDYRRSYFFAEDVGIVRTRYQAKADYWFPSTTEDVVEIKSE